MIDVGINTSEIEVRSQRDGAEVVELDDDNVWISCLYVEVAPLMDANEQVHVPHINLSTSRYVSESPRGSHMSTYDIGTREIIPQLDGPISVLSRLRRRRSSECTRNESDSDPRTTASHRREYPGDDSDDSHNDRRSYRDCRPPERGRSQGHNGRPPERGCHPSRGYSRRDDTSQNGGPLMMEDPLMVEDPLMMEDPLIMEDPQEVDGILDTLEDEDHQDPKDLLDL